MKIFFDKRSGDIRFQVEDQDIGNIGKIAEMIQSEAWKKLREWIGIGREAIIQAGKEGTKRKSNSDLSGLKWSKLDGFDCCSSIAETLVANALEKVKKTESEVNYADKTSRNGSSDAE